jgi:hypothetical protein
VFGDLDVLIIDWESSILPQIKINIDESNNKCKFNDKLG